MAFRQQHDLLLSQLQMWFLENHDECVDSWEVDSNTWRKNHRSLGRILKQEPRRKESFRRACEKWARHRYGFSFVPKDFVYVALEERDRFKFTIRLAIFVYRSDITKALKEYQVYEVMKS